MVDGPQEAEKALRGILRRDSRYAVAAYRFAMESVGFTMIEVLRLAPDQPRHLTGGELAEGMRQLALLQFGFLALDVWRGWGISATIDLGNIIFNLVDADLLHARPEDSVEDFRDVYDLEEGLRGSFCFA